MAIKTDKNAGNYAADYERHLGSLIFEPAAKALLGHIGALPVGSILEIACGTGRVTRHLREHFPATCRLMATDIDPDMLAVAKQGLKGSLIDFRLADAQQLPFPDESFDLIVHQFGLMFLPDKQRGINEAFRVLQTGGHFVFSTWDRASNMALLRLIFDDKLMSVFEGEDTSRFFVSSSLHDPDVLKNYLAGAGFKSFRVVPMKFNGQADSPRHIVNSYFLNHPLGREIKARAPSSFQRITDELEQRIVQQYGPSSFEFELSALLGIARK